MRIDAYIAIGREGTDAMPPKNEQPSVLRLGRSVRFVVQDLLDELRQGAG